MKVVARFIVSSTRARSTAAARRLRAPRRLGPSVRPQSRPRRPAGSATCRAAHRAPARRAGVRRRADRRRRASGDRTPSSAATSDRRPASPAPTACSACRCARRRASVAHPPRQLQGVGAGADLLRHDRGVVEDERHVEAMMRAPAAAVDRRLPVELKHPGVRRRPPAAPPGDRPRSPARATTARRWSPQRTRRPASSADTSGGSWR